MQPNARRQAVACTPLLGAGSGTRLRLDAPPRRLPSTTTRRTTPLRLGRPPQHLLGRLTGSGVVMGCRRMAARHTVLPSWLGVALTVPHCPTTYALSRCACAARSPRGINARWLLENPSPVERGVTCT